MQRNQPKLDLPITETGKILEIAGFLLLLSLWITAFVLYASSPDIIPIHFNMDGKPDGYGNKVFLFLTAGIGTFLYALITVISRYPHVFNYMAVITADNAAQQYRKATTMLRIIKLGILLMMIVIELTSGLSAGRKTGVLPLIFTETFFVAVLPIVIVLYMAPKKKAVKQG